MKAKFLLGGQEVTPNNYEELAISLNFDQDRPESRVSLNEWELGVGSNTLTDGANLSNIHIENGLNGGVGVLEGQPFQIYVKNDLVFDGYLDLSTGTISCDKVTAEAVETGGVDWLNEVADSVTFERLATDNTLSLEDGRIVPIIDYIPVPYVINEVPDVKNLVLTILTTTSVTIQLTDQLQTLAEHITGSSNPFQGVDAVKAALRIVYIIGLIATLVNLIRQLFNLIIQPVKYHVGMKVKTLCEKGCAYFGLNFSSSLLAGTLEDLVLLPEKNTQEENTDKDGLLGLLSINNQTLENNNGYYNGTFGDLLRDLKLMFNAKVIIKNDTLFLERVNEQIGTAIYQVPPVDVDEYRFNPEDLKSNYTIKFATDTNDKNTLIEYLGTEVQIETLPKIVINRGMVLSKGVENINIPFALGKRKRELTFPEELFKVFFKAIDKTLGLIVKVVNVGIKIINIIIKIINKIKKALKTVGINWNINIAPIKPITPPSFSNLIENRIDMLKMENDFIDVPKLVMVRKNSEPRNNKLLNNNETVLRALNIWNNYHSVNSFDSETYTSHSQFIRKRIDAVPFCFEDYELVKGNNVILDSDGVSKGLIESLEWNPITETASIEYRINQVYTKNLKTKILEPNGK